MATLVSSLVVRLVNQVSRPAQGVSRSLLGIRRAADKANGASFSDRLASSVRRNEAALSKARGGLFDAAAGFYALKTAIGAPVREAMRFESSMADVKKVIDEFDTSTQQGRAKFEAFKREIISMSKVLPVSVNGLSQIAAAAGQAGIAGEELTRFTEHAAKIGVAFDISADQAGESMAKMMTGLGLTLDEVTLLADGMNHLSNSQASSASEILDVVRRVGAQGKQYGFTATQVSAFASAMIAAGSSSEVAATSFRNMGKRLTSGASAVKSTKRGLGELGLEAKEVAERMQNDAVGTTIDVLRRISELPKEMQAAVSTDIFGSEARALGPLLTNLELVDKSLGLVSNTGKFAGSAFKEFEARAATFENATQLFNNRLTAMKVVIGSALIPALTDLMDTLSPAIDAIADFAQAHPEVVSNITEAVAAVVAFKVATSTMRFAGLIGRGGALSLLSFGMATVGRSGVGLARAGREALRYNDALAKMAGSRNAFGLTRLNVGLRGMALAVPGVSAMGGVMSAVAGVLGAVGAAVAGITAPVWGGIALGVAAVAAVGLALYKNWETVSAVLRGVSRRIVEGLQPAFERIKPVLDAISPATDLVGAAFTGLKSVIGSVISWFRSTWESFGSWFGGSFSQTVLSESDTASAEARGYALADRVIGALKTGFLTLPTIGYKAIKSLVDGFKSGNALIGGAFKGLKSVVNSLVSWLRTTWETFGDWFGLSFVRTIVSEDDTASAESRGRNLASRVIAALKAGFVGLHLVGYNAIISLLDGMKSAFSGLLSWAGNVPGRIKSVIGSIDLFGFAGRGNPPAAPGEPPSGDEGSPPPSSQPQLSGKRRFGGGVRRGGRYLVGEGGPEVVEMAGDGFVHDAQSSLNLMRGVVDAGRSSLSSLSSIAAPSQGSSAPRPIEIHAPITIGNMGSLDETVSEVQAKLSDALSRAMRGAQLDGE